jgi:hypothetical protein
VHFQHRFHAAGEFGKLIFFGIIADGNCYFDCLFIPVVFLQLRYACFIVIGGAAIGKLKKRGRK